MTYLALYLAVTIAGYFVGDRLKKAGRALPWTGKLQTFVIVILVFLMGSRIGANQEIVASLDSIGLVSLAYTAIIFMVTCAAYSIARRILGFDRYGVRRASGSEQRQDGPAFAEEKENESEGPARKINHLTILIVAFVAIGIAAGYFVLPEGFMALTGQLLTISLCILLVLIGIDIGTEGTLAQNFKSAG